MIRSYEFYTVARLLRRPTTVARLLGLSPSTQVRPRQMIHLHYKFGR